MSAATDAAITTTDADTTDAAVSTTTTDAAATTATVVPAAAAAAPSDQIAEDDSVLPMTWEQIESRLDSLLCLSSVVSKLRELRSQQENLVEVLRQARNALLEKESSPKCIADFDRNTLFQLDALARVQQGELERLGVPTFSVTTNTEQLELQRKAIMYLMQRL
jgi:hypothetical protein